MNSSESARYENMLSAARAGGRAGQRTNELLRELINMLRCKFDASRAALLSEWTDRDMTVGNRIYLAGSVTIVDILDHAANEATKDLRAASGMEAAKPSRRETGSTEGDSPVAKPDAQPIDYSGMEPRKNPRRPIFRDHNCGGCDSGSKPCREGNYNNCSFPRARND